VTITTTGCAAPAGCTLVLSAETVTCDAVTAGTDTYTVTIPFDNGTEGFPGGMNYRRLPGWYELYRNDFGYIGW